MTFNWRKLANTVQKIRKMITRIPFRIILVTRQGLHKTMNLGKLLEDEGQLGVQVVEGIGLALFNYKPI